MGTRTVAPPQNNTSSSSIVANGRSYTCAPGSTITVPDFDAIEMIANGWRYADLIDSLGRAYASQLCDPAKFDVLGDSRMDQMTVNSASRLGWQGNNLFVQANIMSGHRFKVGVIGATSGYRSDQYITSWLPSILASNSGWLFIGFPAVNDITQAAIGAGYTIPTNSLVNPGVVVTLSNVASIVASNLAYAAQQALANGKKVLICAEPGVSQAFWTNASQVTALHNLNLLNRDFAEANSGVFYFSANPVLWNPTASSTLIGYKTNYINTNDGTHHEILAGMAAGAQLSAYLNTLVPYSDLGPCSINDVVGTNPRQLIVNALFNTLTGGTHSGSGTLTSGNVPSGIGLSMPLSSTSCVITSATDPVLGAGNAVTFAFTFGATDVAIISWTAQNFTLGDTIEAGFDFTVASGSNNSSLYAYLNFVGNTGPGNTNPTNVDSYDGYVVPGATANGIGVGPGPTTAYSGRFRTKPVSSVSNNGVGTNWLSQAYLGLFCIVPALGAGNITVTLSRPTIERRY